jgi:hypothetical protein
MKLPTIHFPRFAMSAAAMIAGAGLLAATPVEAVTDPGPLAASASDANVKAQCQFRVTSVAVVDGHTKVTGRLTAKAGPTSFTAARNIAHNSVLCNIHDGESSLASVLGSRNGAYAYASKSVTLPIRSSYALFLKASYVSRNGVTTTFSGSSPQ